MHVSLCREAVGSLSCRVGGEYTAILQREELRPEVTKRAGSKTVPINQNI